MTPLEEKQAARIAELEGALRSMRKLARNAVAEQALFLADGLVHGVERVMAATRVHDGCLGHPCSPSALCPPCAVGTPPNVDRRPDVSDFPLVLDDEAIATLHANGKCPPSCTIGGRHLCGKLCDDGSSWTCMETRGHGGDCNPIPF